MEPRLRLLDDDHHPAFLHPGRTLLVLLHDTEGFDGDDLLAAALYESWDRLLASDEARVSDELGGDSLAILQSLPGVSEPGSTSPVEELILLPTGLALVVLAERLDHLRHLHLRPELRPVWEDVHRDVRAVWLPLAQRVSDRLATRYAHWVRAFDRRLARASRT